MTALSPNTRLRGQMLTDEPMARHTSRRVGGPAARMYLPADIDDLAAMLCALPAEELVYWVGLGSNLLVRDGGLRGTVIMTSGRVTGLSQPGAETIRAEAGVASAKVARSHMLPQQLAKVRLAGRAGR